MNRNAKLVLLGLGAAFLGMLLPIAASLVLTFLAQPSSDVLTIFWENKLQLIPIALGFGLQVGMYAVLRRGLHRTFHVGVGGVTMATGGGTSTLAMIACCAPTGVNLLLPLLGFGALNTMLAGWKMPFMIANVAISGVGIAVMLFALIRQWRAGQLVGSCHREPALS